MKIVPWWTRVKTSSTEANNIRSHLFISNRGPIWPVIGSPTQENLRECPRPQNQYMKASCQWCPTRLPPAVFLVGLKESWSIRSNLSLRAQLPQGVSNAGKQMRWIRAKPLLMDLPCSTETQASLHSPRPRAPKASNSESNRDDLTPRLNSKNTSIVSLDQALTWTTLPSKINKTLRARAKGVYWMVSHRRLTDSKSLLTNCRVTPTSKWAPDSTTHSRSRSISVAQNSILKANSVFLSMKRTRSTTWSLSL